MSTRTRMPGRQWFDAPPFRLPEEHRWEWCGRTNCPQCEAIQAVADELLAPKPLPCPFCGHPGVATKRDGTRFSLECIRCGAVGPNAHPATLASAAEDWNKRAPKRRPDKPTTDKIGPLFQAYCARKGGHSGVFRTIYENGNYTRADAVFSLERAQEDGDAEAVDIAQAMCKMSQTQLRKMRMYQAKAWAACRAKARNAEDEEDRRACVRLHERQRFSVSVAYCPFKKDPG